MTDNVSLSSYYRLTAVIFRQSAMRLRDSYEQSGEQVVGNRMTVPFYYLVSHSAELLLKCALLKRGTAQHDLMNPQLRHNLSLLLSDIIKGGVPVTDQTVRIITALADQHRRHSLRYAFLVDDGSVTFTPDPEELFHALDELLMLGRVSSAGI